MEGHLAGVLAQRKEPAVEEGGVGQRADDADRDIAFAVVCENGRCGKCRVGGGGVDVDGEEVGFGKSCREEEGAGIAGGCQRVQVRG